MMIGSTPETDMELLTAIELTPKQATFFALCNTNFDTIGFMAREGVFQILNGNATLNFDSKGYLKSIKKEIFSYQQSISRQY